jgi:hypothetical protein
MVMTVTYTTLPQLMGAHSEMLNLAGTALLRSLNHNPLSLPQIKLKDLLYQNIVRAPRLGDSKSDGVQEHCVPEHR